MKKKLLVLLIVLVLAVTMIAATACNDSGMIVKNQERNFTQATASVTYGGRSAQVDKLELNATIYNFVYQYYSYYQQGYMGQSDYQAVLDNIDTSYKQANESLAKTEAYTLKCIDELYKYLQANGTDEQKAKAAAASTVGKSYNAADRVKEIESVLPLKDYIAAVEAYNEEMQESFDSYREAYEKEIASGAATTKSTDNIKEVKIVSKPWKLTYEKGESLLENGLKVSVIYEGDPEKEVELDRTDYTVTGFSSEEVKDKVEVKVTFGNSSTTFDVEIIAAKPSRPALPEEDEEEEEKTEVPALFEVDLDEQIAAAKTEGDTALYKVLQESKRRLEKQMTSNYRSYEYYYLSKLKTQAVTAYETIIGEGEGAKVSGEEINAEFAKKLESQKQELLLGSSKYSDKTDASGIKEQIVHEDGQVFYVWNLLFKITDDLQAKYDAFEKEKVANKEALEKFLNDRIDEIGVYASNVEYDKDAKCEEEECTCTACENYKGENPGPCTAENCACEKCPNKRFITEVKYGNDKTLNAREDGTFDVKEMLAAVYEDLGTIEENSTAEEKTAMLKKFKKWIYTLNDDEGFFTTLTDGKVGYSLSMTDSSYVENFTALSRALAYGTAAEKDEWHVVGTGVGSYGWCYTNYGIHVVMLSGYALPEKYKENEYRVDGTDYYALPANAVTDYGSYKSATETDLAKGTIAYEIKEDLASDKKDELIGDFKKKFYQEELDKDAKITYYDVYKDLIKQYKN